MKFDRADPNRESHAECQGIVDQSNTAEFKPTKSAHTKPSQAPKYLIVVDVHLPKFPLYSIAATTSIADSFPLYQSPPRRHNVGTFSPTLRAYGWQCPQLSGANGDRNLSLHPLAPTDKLIPSQRSTTSSSKDAASEAAASPFRLTVAGTATTVVAIGSMAWYYHLYGPTLYAMTPQEEG